jgi:ABC-type bacteriocin/lantibiotic exporter with double-glycine peptidase domain
MKYKNILDTFLGAKYSILIDVMIAITSLIGFITESEAFYFLTLYFSLVLMLYSILNYKFIKKKVDEKINRNQSREHN